MSPAGFFAIVAMPVVGRLIGRGTDARWLIAAGGDDGRRELLDVADELEHQPGPSRLAARTWHEFERGLGALKVRVRITRCPIRLCSCYDLPRFGYWRRRGFFLRSVNR